MADQNQTKFGLHTASDQWANITLRLHTMKWVQSTTVSNWPQLSTLTWVIVVDQCDMWQYTCIGDTPPNTTNVASWPQEKGRGDNFCPPPNFWQSDNFQKTFVSERKLKIWARESPTLRTYRGKIKKFWASHNVLCWKIAVSDSWKIITVY